METQDKSIPDWENHKRAEDMLESRTAVRRSLVQLSSPDINLADHPLFKKAGFQYILPDGRCQWNKLIDLSFDELEELYILASGEYKQLQNERQ